jgi:hypothetical protein
MLLQANQSSITQLITTNYRMFLYGAWD